MRTTSISRAVVKRGLFCSSQGNLCVPGTHYAWNSRNYTAAASRSSNKHQRQITRPIRWGLELLGKRRKAFAKGVGPSRAEQAGASESLGSEEGS